MNPKIRKCFGLTKTAGNHWRNLFKSLSDERMILTTEEQSLEDSKLFLVWLKLGKTTLKSRIRVWLTTNWLLLLRDKHQNSKRFRLTKSVGNHSHNILNVCLTAYWDLLLRHLTFIISLLFLFHFLFNSLWNPFFYKLKKQMFTSIKYNIRDYSLKNFSHQTWSMK